MPVARATAMDSFASDMCKAPVPPTAREAYATSSSGATIFLLQTGTARSGIGAQGGEEAGTGAVQRPD